MPYNLIFIDESESMQRAVATIFLNNPEFNLNLVSEPQLLYKAVKNFAPDIIVLSYNTIDTELKKSITEIKTSKEFSGTPLILLVPSDLSENERETLIKLKADGFIYRPFDKDAFISKIKRTLGGNNTAGYAAENPQEKIYDISLFEAKKMPLPDSISPPAVPGGNLTESSGGGYEISETASEQAGGDAPNSYYYDESAGDNKERGAIGLESSELSRAFENLFKDDAIFKEFQDLNKKEGEPLEIMELPAQAEQQQELNGYETPLEIMELPPPAEQAASEEISIPAEPAAPESLADVLGLNKPSLPEESGDSAFSEPFAGFNISGDDNRGELNEFKPAANINTEKFGGELNLKILDEQNLVKLDDYLKNAIEKTFEDIKPQIMEKIKNGLPEIIEKLVKEEIEKIKRQ